MTPEWVITNGPQEAAPLADHRRFRFVIERGEEARDLFVEISGTAAATRPDSLPSPIGEAVRTSGLDAVRRYIDEANREGTAPPATIAITTTGEWERISPSYSPARDRSTT